MHSDKHTPRFNEFYTGPWPHHYSEGVGLAFTGAPNDPIEFIDLFQQTGCSPPATRRILDELQAGQTKYTTVRATLDFNFIGRSLQKLGVEMRIVAPSLTPSDQRMDSAALSMVRGRPCDMEGFSAEELEAVQLIYAQTLSSMARIPFGIGAFG